MRLPRVRLSTFILATLVASLSLTVVVQQQRFRSSLFLAGSRPPPSTQRPRISLAQAARLVNQKAAVLAKERAASAAKDRAIHSALSGTLESPPPSGATLQRFLHHITSVTYTEELTNGIPIKVDLVGLEEAGISLTATVMPSSERVSVREALSEQLDRLGLDYVVKGGVMTITSKESADKPLIGGSAVGIPTVPGSSSPHLEPQ
jgi:hypothetical protein